MQVISSVPFSHLKNAEHVSFLTNVGIAIAKITPEAVGLTSALVKQYNDAVALEQDIVNHSNGSVYTPEMRALDDERDRLFKLIRLKLQTILLESADSELAQYSNTVEMLILKKYGLEVAAAPYQEESSLIRGFLLDVRNFLAEETIEALGITADLTALETANNNFADQYNERVTEKSTSISAYGKKVRADAEALYNLVGLHVEYMSNSDKTEVGTACSQLLAVINQLIKDVQQRLNSRAGKVSDTEEEEEDTPNISPVPFPSGK